MRKPRLIGFYVNGILFWRAYKKKSYMGKTFQAYPCIKDAYLASDK